MVRTRIIGRGAAESGNGLYLTGVTLREVSLPSGGTVPVLGIGTWGMGEQPGNALRETAAIHTALDLGMSVVDTAEMYGNGAAEELVGRALAARRNEAFLITKVLPHHATMRGTIDACEGSLRRLGTDTIDLYLLHWRGAVPLAETLEAFEHLQDVGKIRHWGVSNFDVADMEELRRSPGGRKAATDQVLYNMTRRGIEFDLLPDCVDKGIPVMAYSPLEQGRMLNDPALVRIATEHGVSPAQIALAWVLRQPLVLAIPKASSPQHVQECRRALDIRLTPHDLAELDRVYPPPTHKRVLEMI
ncbi:diketogulonate reductase-like aldo/keto reductase [Paenarthrobacter nitroguajacolicus]|uniref:aldo/keto reductase n=1 Tax=Paenarthrobacter nitroguajacolicus TaxID=211146 RepID=UPI002860DAFF|nr:aldo/keto reductase [Paenarthrobacter nitroguajacolicus]MDR6987557.1 diketogulonate reductase-like aldo/keto reductase [Paenarthrobacter nitroguajacolicus]